MKRSRHWTYHTTPPGWAIACVDARIPLGFDRSIPLPGYFVRLEHYGYRGRLEVYRGPSRLLPRALNWWWRPTSVSALRKAHQEARRR